MDAYDSITIMTVPAASPSSPSVRFTALRQPTIMKNTSPRYSQGIAMVVAADVHVRRQDAEVEVRAQERQR